MYRFITLLLTTSVVINQFVMTTAITQPPTSNKSIKMDPHTLATQPTQSSAKRNYQVIDSITAVSNKESHQSSKFQLQNSQSGTAQDLFATYSMYDSVKQQQPQQQPTKHLHQQQQLSQSQQQQHSHSQTPHIPPQLQLYQSKYVQYNVPANQDDGDLDDGYQNYNQPMENQIDAPQEAKPSILDQLKSQQQELSDGYGVFVQDGYQVSQVEKIPSGISSGNQHQQQQLQLPSHFPQQSLQQQVQQQQEEYLLQQHLREQHQKLLQRQQLIQQQYLVQQQQQLQQQQLQQQHEQQLLPQHYQHHIQAQQHHHHPLQHYQNSAYNTQITYATPAPLPQTTITTATTARPTLKQQPQQQQEQPHQQQQQKQQQHEPQQQQEEQQQSQLHQQQQPSTAIVSHAATGNEASPPSSQQQSQSSPQTSTTAIKSTSFQRPRNNNSHNNNHIPQFVTAPGARFLANTHNRPHSRHPALLYGPPPAHSMHHYSKQYKYAPMRFVYDRKLPYSTKTIPYPPSFISLTTTTEKPLKYDQSPEHYTSDHKAAYNKVPDFFVHRTSKSLLDSYIPSWQVIKMLQQFQIQATQPKESQLGNNLETLAVPFRRNFKRNTNANQGKQS